MKRDRDLDDNEDSGRSDAPSAATSRNKNDNPGPGSSTAGGHPLGLETGISNNSTDGEAPTTPSTPSVNKNTSSSSSAAPTASATTNFRNVSACNRCRNRKNRCDQRLPRCSGCAKANVKCVGFDPVSKREIPRSYVYYLETRVATLEALLRANDVPCPPPSDDFSISEAIRPGVNVPFPAIEEEGQAQSQSSSTNLPSLNAQTEEVEGMLDPALHEHDDHERLSKLANKVGVVSVHGPTDSRHQQLKASGIPFSRVVFAAVKSSVPHAPAGGSSHAPPSKQLPSATASGGGGSSSFFALHTKPSVRPAPFPEKAAGMRLVELYFEHANPQIPILHRPEFMALFDRVYAVEPAKRTPRELYLVNMVFAIGAGIINDSSNADQGMASMAKSAEDGSEGPNRKRQKLADYKNQPEEYHASAIVHLDSFLGMPATSESVGGGLEELQAVLLLAGLALLRPVAPGLWYIIGVAVRLAIDLGLHFEEVDPELDNGVFIAADKSNFKAPGRRQWTRDFRRRLWWCTFSFDRLVSTCVGRPVGIVDQVITTSFPTILDDKDITPMGFLRSPRDVEMPTYKLVARHYFRLRLLQSEILQVLQYRQAEQTRTENAATNFDPVTGESYIRTDLPSPFLHGFSSFRDWRADVDRRLWEWKESAPRQFETGVAFTPLFLELNYWQAVIMLYRQSLAVPEPLAGEMSPSTGEDVQSPGTANIEAKEDEQMVFMKVAQAGQTVLKIYRRLHRLKLVNYTFLATHHLFMSGISFLYAIWHSTLVRSQLTLDDVDFTVLIATSVLTDLIDKCPPAEACRDAFVRMSKATISMCMNTTGFGNASTLGTQPLNNPATAYLGRGGGNRSRAQSGASVAGSSSSPSMRAGGRKMRMPKFDYNLKDLFSEEEIANRPMHHMQQHQHTHGGSSFHTSGGQHPQFPPTYLATSPRSAVGNNSAQNTSNPQQQHQSPLLPTSPPNPQTSNPALQSEFPYSDFDFLDLPFTPTSPLATHQNQSPYPSSLNPGPQPGLGNGYSLGLWGELDLGFGTGGTATHYHSGPEPGAAGFVDGGGQQSVEGQEGATGSGNADGGAGGWDAGGYGAPGGGYGTGGGVDLFDGFFFGNGGG